MINLRTKLIISFSLVIVLGICLFIVAGSNIITNTIMRQAQDKVRLDLNSAHEVYSRESQDVYNLVRLTALRFFIKDAVRQNDRKQLYEELNKILINEQLDILTLVRTDKTVLIRANNPGFVGDKVQLELVEYVLTKPQAAVATSIINHDILRMERETLADQARITLIATPKARPIDKIEEFSGMMIMAAAPILDDQDKVIAVLYGGKLLNRNFSIVDKVKDIVYRGEKYKGRDIGTATIFQDDIRITTNVLNIDGTRAIGTRVSEEVYQQVVGQAIPWIGRAFVVNAWYFTAYEPIYDINKKIIGMLYVGVLERPYVDLRNQVIMIFIGIGILSVVLLFVIAYFSSSMIVKPLKELLVATDKLAKGELSHRVNIKTGDEIGDLAISFNRMAEELQNASGEYQELLRTLEHKVKEKTEELMKTQDYLFQTEKLTALGKLAAGIAHEINNPLTSILINSHLVAERLDESDPVQKHLKLIIDETTRCGNIVKGLLQFSRQSPPEMELTNINDLVNSALMLFESQLLLHKVKVKKDIEKDLPLTMIDPNKIRQVFANVLINSIDAMPDGGNLTIVTKYSSDRESLIIEFEDTGHGMDQDVMSKIFDPFFTTKGVKGTGLGLAVSYGIVEQHKGTITVASEPGAGTKFAIVLPIRSN